MSLRGYCRTLIVFIACNPAMRMTKLTTSARTGRLMKRSVNDFIELGIDWGWIHLRLRREIVVDRYRHAVAQFEDASADDRFACLQPIHNRDEITTRFTDSNKLLADGLRFFAGFFVLLFLNHKNRIAERRIGNGGAGDHERLVFFRQRD